MIEANGGSGKFGLPYVVRRSGLDLQNVRHNEFLVITFALDEEVCDLRLFELFGYPFPPRLSRICGIEYGNLVCRVFQPIDHICDCCLSSGFSRLLAFYVASIEELCIWMRRPFPSIFANIEDLRFD